MLGKGILLERVESEIGISFLGRCRGVHSTNFLEEENEFENVPLGIKDEP